MSQERSFHIFSSLNLACIVLVLMQQWLTHILGKHPIPMIIAIVSLICMQ